MKVRQIVQALLPWTPRDQRKQAIAQAREDRIAAERKTQHAKAEEERLRRAVMDNHIAEAIAWHLRGSDK